MAKLGLKISPELSVQVNDIVLIDFSVSKWVVK